MPGRKGRRLELVDAAPSASAYRPEARPASTATRRERMIDAALAEISRDTPIDPAAFASKESHDDQRRD